MEHLLGYLGMALAIGGLYRMYRLLSTPEAQWQAKHGGYRKA